MRLSDLRSPPGNRLEALKGGRAGQYSLRINDQWRVCFVWREAPENDDAGGNVDAVEIVDYPEVRTQKLGTESSNHATFDSIGNNNHGYGNEGR